MTDDSKKKTETDIKASEDESKKTSKAAATEKKVTVEEKIPKPGVISTKKGKKKVKSVRDVIIESIECEPGIEGCTGDPDTCPNDPSKCDKKLSMFGYYDDTITESVEQVLSRSMDQMTKTFSASARRWELIVYPSVFAFTLLAAYGFFLIYSLTQDVGTMAKDMHSITQDMHLVATRMESVSNNMNSVSHNMTVMTETMKVQSKSIHEMNAHIRNMAMSMGRMTHDMSIMNNSISRPMQFMNDFMPW